MDLPRVLGAMNVSASTAFQQPTAAAPGREDCSAET